MPDVSWGGGALLLKAIDAQRGLTKRLPEHHFLSPVS